MRFLEVETPFFGWGSQLNHSFLSVLLSLCAPTPIWHLVLGLSSHNFFIENSGFKTGVLARFFNPQKSSDFWDGKLPFNFPVPKTARSKTPAFRSDCFLIIVLRWSYSIPMILWDYQQ